jgi:hypothetical protein
VVVRLDLAPIEHVTPAAQVAAQVTQVARVAHGQAGPAMAPQAPLQPGGAATTNAPALAAASVRATDCSATTRVTGSLVTTSR